MTQLEQTLYNKEYETPPLYDDRYLIEQLKPAQLRDLILECGIKVAELRRVEALATDVLGGYGENQ